MSTEVFVDSGAFVAFLDRSDGQHQAAANLFANPPTQLITSGLVVAESYGWFLHRLGEPAARIFRSFLDDLEGLTILDTDAGHRAAVWRKLDELRGTKLTFVDASALVWLKERGVSTVWGTDFDLGVEGAAVLPGPPR